jgi:hypothetical protein
MVWATYSTVHILRKMGPSLPWITKKSSDYMDSDNLEHMITYIWYTHCIHCYGILKYVLKTYNSMQEYTKKMAKRKYSSAWKTCVHTERCIYEHNLKNSGFRELRLHCISKWIINTKINIDTALYFSCSHYFGGGGCLKVCLVIYSSIFLSL